MGVLSVRAFCKGSPSPTLHNENSRCSGNKDAGAEAYIVLDHKVKEDKLHIGDQEGNLQFDLVVAEEIHCQGISYIGDNGDQSEPYTDVVGEEEIAVYPQHYTNGKEYPFQPFAPFLGGGSQIAEQADPGLYRRTVRTQKDRPGSQDHLADALHKEHPPCSLPRGTKSIRPHSHQTAYISYDYIEIHSKHKLSSV